MCIVDGSANDRSFDSIFGVVLWIFMICNLYPEWVRPVARLLRLLKYFFHTYLVARFISRYRGCKFVRRLTNKWNKISFRSFFDRYTSILEIFCSNTPSLGFPSFPMFLVVNFTNFLTFSSHIHFCPRITLATYMVAMRKIF